MDQVRIARNGPKPTYTIRMQGLAHINFDFKLLDSSGQNKISENRGENSEAQFTFPVGAEVDELDGRLLSLQGIAADFSGASAPYTITVTIDQGETSSSMTVKQPSMSEGHAVFFGLARFSVQ